jgi:hypothetical protein
MIFGTCQANFASYEKYQFGEKVKGNELTLTFKCHCIFIEAKDGPSPSFVVTFTYQEMFFATPTLSLYRQATSPTAFSKSRGNAYKLHLTIQLFLKVVHVSIHLLKILISDKRSCISLKFGPLPRGYLRPNLIYLGPKLSRLAL